MYKTRENGGSSATLKNNTVEVYTHPLDGAYQEMNTFKVGEVLRFEALGLELLVGRIFG